MPDLVSPSPWIVPAVVFGAYLLGGVSPGWWLVRQKTGADLREEGSGTTGATNTARVLGRRGYVSVLILDTVKGMAAVYLARYLAPDEPWALLAGPAVVAGHIWPIWLKFKGGRGASPFMGVALAQSGAGIWIVPIAWVPGTIAGILARNGFVARAIAFLASLPLGWWLIHGSPAHASFVLAWLLVLLAHRSYLFK